MTDGADAPDDDLAQVVLRGLAAGPFTALMACGAALAALASYQPEQDVPLLAAPGAGLAYVVGVGLGGGAAFAAAELAWALPRRVRLLAAALVLAVGGALAPLLGAFELLLLLTGSSVEAWTLLTEGLRAAAWPPIAVVASLAVALGLPLLAARRAALGLTWQAAVTAWAGAAWLVALIGLEAPLPDAPLLVHALLLLAGGLAAPVALEVADRLLLRWRGRARRRGASRGRARAAAALLALLVGAQAALLAPLPTARPHAHRTRLRAATTRDPERLRTYVTMAPSAAWASSRAVISCWGWSPPRPAPGPSPMTGHDADAVRWAVELRVPDEDAAASRVALLRPAAAALPEVRLELAELLLPTEPEEARRLLLQALRDGSAQAAALLARQPLEPATRLEVELALVAGVRRDDPTWVRVAILWWHHCRTTAACGVVARHLIERVDRGDAEAVEPVLELSWVAPELRPDLEDCLARAAERAPGPEEGVARRALRSLLRLVDQEPTPRRRAAALAALRRHATFDENLRPALTRLLEGRP